MSKAENYVLTFSEFGVEWKKAKELGYHLKARFRIGKTGTMGKRWYEVVPWSDKKAMVRATHPSEKTDLHVHVSKIGDMRYSK